MTDTGNESRLRQNFISVNPVTDVRWRGKVSSHDQRFKVKTALLADSSVSGLDIHVETFKGRVHLNGLVNFITEDIKAEELVRDVKGVVLVKNNITVK